MEIDKRITINPDNTGTLEYIHPKTKMKAIFNFPLLDTSHIDDQIIESLSQSFIQRAISCI